MDFCNLNFAQNIRFRWFFKNNTEKVLQTTKIEITLHHDKQQQESQHIQSEGAGKAEDNGEHQEKSQR